MGCWGTASRKTIYLAWGEYEMRYAYLPEELKPWRPLWINSEFLQKSVFRDGFLKVGDLAFSTLYMDVKYLDISALKRMAELADQGLPGEKDPLCPEIPTLSIIVNPCGENRRYQSG